MPTKTTPKQRHRKLTLAERLSAAAYKAWETRRANGWVHPSKRVATPVRKPRSVPVASKRSTVPPLTPAQQRAAMLSDRALRAWETRRANAR